MASLGGEAGAVRTGCHPLGIDTRVVMVWMPPPLFESDMLNLHNLVSHFPIFDHVSLPGKVWGEGKCWQFCSLHRMTPRLMPTLLMNMHQPLHYKKINKSNCVFKNALFSISCLLIISRNKMLKCSKAYLNQNDEGQRNYADHVFTSWSFSSDQSLY